MIGPDDAGPVPAAPWSANAGVARNENVSAAASRRAELELIILSSPVQETRARERAKKIYCQGQSAHRSS
jgi:hypothetical protein